MRDTEECFWNPRVGTKCLLKHAVTVPSTLRTPEHMLDDTWLDRPRANPCVPEFHPLAVLEELSLRRQLRLKHALPDKDLFLF